MAKPTTYKGSQVAIFLEDPSSAGTFIKPCGLNNHTLSFTKDMQEVNVPDCDDPDLPQWKERDASALDFGGSGEGVLAAESLEAWWDYFNQTDPVNARIYIGNPDNVANGFFWSGQLHISNFEIVGNTGTRATVSISVVSNGELTLTPVST